MSNQGKRKEQVEFSNDMTYWAFIGILVLTIASIISKWQ